MTKSWVQDKKLNPKILEQANIPKPLHGINPRTIMGQDSWDVFRKSILLKQPYCTACGATGYLEIHEDYSYDFTKGIAIINSYVPICKTCHMFIHSGRLASLVVSKEITIQEAKRIVSHGISILSANKLKMYSVTHVLAKSLGLDTKNVQSWQPQNYADWDKWVLIYNNKKYKGLSKKQWDSKYS